MHTGPIILIEDDDDDQYILQKVFNELNVPNHLLFFDDGQQALDYLLVTTEQPFLILCDINMPVMGGLELRAKIDADNMLKEKAIPFIFLTTDASPALIQQAYTSTIQGFFKKALSYEGIKDQVRWLVDYWQHCLHPHNHA